MAMRYIQQLGLQMTALDARVLRAIPTGGRTAVQIAQVIGCRTDVVRSSLRRLRGRGLIEWGSCGPARECYRTRDGDLILEWAP